METSHCTPGLLCFHSSNCLRFVPFQNRFPVPVLEKYFALFFKFTRKQQSDVLVSLVGYIWAGDADMASHLSVNFDERLSGKSGYVHQSYKIDEIVRDWELCTNSSFTLWVVDDNFGTIGKSDGPNKQNSGIFSHLFTIKWDQLNPQLVFLYRGPGKRNSSIHHQSICYV